jgi:hypothetical protein
MAVRGASGRFVANPGGTAGMPNLAPVPEKSGTGAFFIQLQNRGEEGWTAQDDGHAAKGRVFRSLSAS